MVVSASVLFGWAAGIPWLTSLSPHLVTMKPFTAAGFFLSGISLALLVYAPPFAARRHLAKGVALVVALIGVATIVEFATGRNLHFEDLLFRHILYATGIPNPGRLSPATAAAFIFLGLGLALLDWETPKGIRPSQFLFFCVVFFSFVNFLGYLYGVDDLYRTLRQNPMAVHTAFSFSFWPWQQSRLARTAVSSLFLTVLKSLGAWPVALSRPRFFLPSRLVGSACSASITAFMAPALVLPCLLPPTSPCLPS